MRFGNGTLQTFISDRRRTWVFCANCGQACLHNTFKLADRYGADSKLEVVRQTLACPSCRESGACYFIPEAYHRLIVPNSRRYAEKKISHRGWLKPVRAYRWVLYCTTLPCGGMRILSEDEVENLSQILPLDFDSEDPETFQLCVRCQKKSARVVLQETSNPAPTGAIGPIG